MEDNHDDDNNPTKNEMEGFLGYTFQKGVFGNMVIVECANSTRKKPQTQSKGVPPKFTSLLTKKQYLLGYSISTDIYMTVTMILTPLWMWYLWHWSCRICIWKQKGKNGGRGVPAPKECECICTLFSIDPYTYTNIIRECLSTQNTHVSKSHGNASVKEMQISKTPAAVVKNWEFDRKENWQRCRITAQQVRDFVLAKKLFVVPKDEFSIYEKIFFHNCIQECEEKIGVP